MTTRKRNRVTLKFTEPSMTQQNFKDECNINSIMKRYEKTGILSHVSGKTPIHGDFSDIPDYQATLNKITEAGEAFASLPAAVRRRFNDNPAEFVEFCVNPENGADLVEMGLAEIIHQEQTEDIAPQENVQPDSTLEETQD